MPPKFHHASLWGGIMMKMSRTNQNLMVLNEGLMVLVKSIALDQIEVALCNKWGINSLVIINK